MLANDMKKGMRIRLRDIGWYGTIADNAKGSTRMVDVEGTYREIGSVYTHDIESVLNPATNLWESVELSPRQKEQARLIRGAGF